MFMIGQLSLFLSWSLCTFHRRALAFDIVPGASVSCGAPKSKWPARESIVISVYKFVTPSAFSPMSSSGNQHSGALVQPPVARKSGLYSCLDALGKGTYGVCYKVKHKAGGVPCVMKVVPLSGLTSKHIKAAFSEAMILRKVKHPHVVGYHDAWVENSHLYIVMDYCSEGDLAMLLKARKLAYEDIWGFARDISCGLEHLHSSNIMHRCSLNTLERVFLMCEACRTCP